MSELAELCLWLTREITACDEKTVGGPIRRRALLDVLYHTGLLLEQRDASSMGGFSSIKEISHVAELASITTEPSFESKVMALTMGMMASDCAASKHNLAVALAELVAGKQTAGSDRQSLASGS